MAGKKRAAPGKKFENHWAKVYLPRTVEIVMSLGYDTTRTPFPSTVVPGTCFWLSSLEEHCVVVFPYVPWHLHAVAGA